MGEHGVMDVAQKSGHSAAKRGSFSQSCLLPCNVGEGAGMALFTQSCAKSSNLVLQQLLGMHGGSSAAFQLCLLLCGLTRRYSTISGVVG